MRAPLLAALLVVAGLAGCLETDPGQPRVDRGGGDTDTPDGNNPTRAEPTGAFDVIWVRGLEDPPNGSACQDEPTHALHRPTSRKTEWTFYHRGNLSLAPANISSMIAVTIWTTGGCRIHDALHVNQEAVETRGFVVGFEQDRVVLKSEDLRRSVPLAGAVTETYDRIEGSPKNGTVDGTIRVEDIGPWRRANLQEVDEIPEEVLDWPVRGDPPLRLTPWRMDEIEGAFSLVVVDGWETASPTAGVCDTRFSHDVDLAERTLAYDAQRYRFDPANLSRLVAFDHFRENQCPNAYDLVPDEEATTRRIGHYGNLSIAFADNRTVQVEERTWLSPGENITVHYNETVQSEYESWQANGSVSVTYLGSWPRTSLQPQPWR